MRLTIRHDMGAAHKQLSMQSVVHVEKYCVGAGIHPEMMNFKLKHFNGAFQVIYYCSYNNWLRTWRTAVLSPPHTGTNVRWPMSRLHPRLLPHG